MSTVNEPLSLIKEFTLSSTAVETNCQGSLPAPPNPGFRLCDARSPLGSCCGGQYHNPRSQLCCRDQVLYKKPGHDCCGSLTYNPTSQLCCLGVAISKRGSLNACCGRVPYDNRKQSCCSGQVVAKPVGQPSRCCG